MPIYVILGTPGAFDFEAFGESTRKTLALLAPLVDLEHSETNIAKETLAQVREFARAIRLGVDAAQHGFTAIEDVLTLTRLMNSTTLEGRTEYLQGTLELADQAYSKAKEAFQVFRDIRTKIFGVTDRYNTAARSVPPFSIRVTFPREDAARRSIEELQKNIHVLEEFGNQISALVQWWDWITIETHIERVDGNGRPTISFDDSSLRQESVVERWILLRNQFADYTNMIGQLEDSYPELLMPHLNERNPSPPRVPMRGIDLHRPDLEQAVRSFRAEIPVSHDHHSHTTTSHTQHHDDYPLRYRYDDDSFEKSSCGPCGCVIA